MRLRDAVRRTPLLGTLAVRLWRWLRKPAAAPAREFPGSARYWDSRYQVGGNSGVGSYGKFAEFKADVLNALVAEFGIASVIELGCGDGSQLGLARYPRYLGFDVSERALELCREKFAADASKSFKPMAALAGERAELTLSLDVIYHLVEDRVFEQYMRGLFDAATRFVAIYSSNTDEPLGQGGPHVRHRRFSAWIERNRPGWRLLRHVPNRHPYRGDYREGSFADFYVYTRDPAA